MFPRHVKCTVINKVICIYLTCSKQIVPRRYFCGGSYCFMSWCLKFWCCWRLMYVIIFLVKVTEWPPIGNIAAHSAYDMFSWYKYLNVNLVFSRLGF